MPHCRSYRPALDLLAYRVVQEALTNVVKHGGVGATAEVRISCDGGAVAIEVRNTAAAPGDGADGEQIGGGGRGLAGMRERVALYGGHLDTRADADGSFSVRRGVSTGPGRTGRAGALRYARTCAGASAGSGSGAR